MPFTVSNIKEDLEDTSDVFPAPTGLASRRSMVEIRLADVAMRQGASAGPAPH